MAGNPREHVKGKGFWDGGASGYGRNGETAGRPDGFPGTLTPALVGVRTDIEFYPDKPDEKQERTED